MEWARYGIRVNAVAPGIVDSAMWGEIELALGILENRTVEEIRSRYGDERVPLGRFAVPNDIGKLVSFLASSDSEYITGQTMVCDGGVQFA
jgi:meso-butanediol dehydrogenase/(S,S)-butanediol dehydrogenase/diacetyl reductase